jgi:hypothetical protein
VANVKSIRLADRTLEKLLIFLFCNLNTEMSTEIQRQVFKRASFSQMVRGRKMYNSQTSMISDSVYSVVLYVVMQNTNTCLRRKGMT